MNLDLNKGFNTLLELEKTEDSYQSSFINRIKYKFKKKEIDELRDKIAEYFKNNIMSSEWTSQYLYDLQYTLVAYNDKLEKYISDFIIIDYDYRKEGKNIFLPMIFYWHYTTTITVTLIADNINMIYNTTDESLSLSSTGTTSDSQKKYEEMCKKVLVSAINAYIYRERNSESNESIQNKERSPE